MCIASPGQLHPPPLASSSGREEPTSTLLWATMMLQSLDLHLHRRYRVVQLPRCPGITKIITILLGVIINTLLPARL
ncbi:hypothetical protein BCR35DRAFT_332117 [Leucosporidium creatinivorum]|uniref:Uncharacterized protein n=1 Tax=Leucosporidium creatinivorum TaxID=106004 RepID=A0A1Y2F7M0_9BASI|nr:hypothetical protein BCR35DRAFT_332117 [Leucosporidium creatinivorum]